MKNKVNVKYIILIGLIIILLITTVSLKNEIETKNALIEQNTINNIELECELNSEISKLLINSDKKDIEINNLNTEMNKIVDKTKQLQDYVDLIKDKERYLQEGISRKYGIDNLIIIKEDLYSKPELIGFSGILGGTMVFGEADFLNDRWVYVQFSDGHICGSGIYEYKVLDNGEIEWTLVTDMLCD